MLLATAWCLFRCEAPAVCVGFPVLPPNKLRPESLEPRITPAIAVSPLAVPPTGLELGHAVDFFKASDLITDLESALDLTTDESRQLFVSHDDGVPVIDYADFTNSPDRNLFQSTRDIRASGAPFAANDANDYVIRTHGCLFIPKAGKWTFSVNSDDGFRLRMGAEGAVVAEFTDARAPATSSSTVKIAAPGYYPYELVYFERDGGAEVEFFATGPGQATPRLVGDPAGRIKVFHTDHLIAPLPGRLVGGAPGHAVSFFQGTGLVDSLADADALIATPASAAFTLIDNGVSVVNYQDDEDPGGGNFGNDRDLNAIAGSLFNATGGDDNFAMRATGVLYLPQGGDWRFTVNSDDGFRLHVGGWEVAAFDGTKSASDVNGIFSAAAPGFYPYELVYFEHAAGAGVELSARGPGQDVNVLVGDTANGGLAVFQNVAATPANPASIGLGGLAGGNGFKISGAGEADAAQAGYSVGAAGDVNGDGFDDLIIGVKNATGADIGSGAAYVVFGKAGGFPAGLSGANLDGTNGFVIRGLGHDYDTGASVSGAGDVNGDGFDDLVIGAYDSDVGGPNRGAVYVVFGKADGFAPVLSTAALDGSNGFTILGAANGDNAGFSASGAGDVNGDGFADLIIGAPFAHEGGSERGAAYVVFGKAGGFGASLSLSSLDGSAGFKLSGVANSDRAGRSVSGAGDVNGDGFADLIVGAPYAREGGSERGAAYVVFGKAGGFGASVALAGLDGSAGFKLSGVANDDRAGFSVSGAGDVDGDGFDDLIVGALFAHEGGTNRGAAYVVFGHAGGFGASVALASLDGNAGFKLRGVADFDNAGFSVSGAGDLNGDGFADLIVGAFGADEGGNNRGAAYVVFGRTGGFGASMALSGLDGSNGFKLSGAADNDNAGSSVGGAGDVNGDGFDDLVISALSADEGGTNRGAACVVFGSTAERTMAASPSQTLAPFTIALNARRAVFTDADGDLISLKVSKGTLAPGDFILHAAGLGARLVLLNLSDDGREFSGSNITLTATPQEIDGVLRGNGRADLGTLEATGVRLGTVSISGTLDVINAGNGFDAIESLTLGGLGTAGAKALQQSNLFGSVPLLTVKGDIIAAKLLAGSISAAIVTGTLNAGGVDGAGIFSTSTIGHLSIKGGLLGDAAHRVEISANGTPRPASNGQAKAIKTLTIGGSVEHAHLSAGGEFNADAGLGKVIVKGNWLATDLTAGVSAGVGGYFGDANDTPIPGGNAIVSRIAAITIKGSILATPGTGDIYGIIAQKIGSLKVGGLPVLLTPGASNDLTPLTPGTDLRVREVV